MIKEFPKGFWWGAATSGVQSEGRFNKKHANNFDYFFETSPELFYEGVGPDVASNFYNSFREDIAMMKSIGLNSIRTSIQWTRLIDDLEEATLNKDGVRYYNEVIDEFIKNGIRPIMNMSHFDLPVELEHKYGGWLSKHVVDLYVKFAEKCFELFSDRVVDWFTFNEPIVVVEGSYLHQFHYPMIVDGKKAMQAAFNLQIASSRAIQSFRKRNKNPKGKIGIVLNLTPPYPRSDSAKDKLASFHADLFGGRLFMDPSTLGTYPKELLEILEKEGVMWEASEEEYQIIKDNIIDCLGVNFYQPARVKEPDLSSDSLAVDWMPTKYYDNWDMPGRRMNMDKNWEIYPKAIYDIAKNIQDNYGNISWYVSENGMGVSREERYLNKDCMIEDDYRIQFITEHLYYLHKAIEEGSNCFGYHLWTPIDCWSWTNAYRNRYGFISNDIHTQIKTVKKSGYWFKDIAETDKLDVPDVIIDKFEG
jgi:6-phospho-beta-glucosidase